jgi:hypothetical protein
MNEAEALSRARETLRDIAGTLDGAIEADGVERMRLLWQARNMAHRMALDVARENITESVTPAEARQRIAEARALLASIL